MVFSDTVCRTVPSQNDILVPETLLKKRKSQEKEREARAAEIEKKKKVRSTSSFLAETITKMMTIPHIPTRQKSMMSFLLTIFRD